MKVSDLIRELQEYPNDTEVNANRLDALGLWWLNLYYHDDHGYPRQKCIMDRLGEPYEKI